jgi:hypothetical protein
MRDNYDNLKFVPAIAPAVVSDNTAQVSAIVDRFGFESATFVIQTGTLADTDATFAVLLEDGNNSGLSDNAAVSDSLTLNTQSAASFTFAADAVCRKIGYIGSKRYLRLTITPSSNSTTAPMAAIAVLGNANSRPVA